MPKIRVKAQASGTHTVFLGTSPVMSGLALDDAENFATFLKASARYHTPQDRTRSVGA
ncbi:hypothetical protein J2X36_004396 [Methylobacterium sp. BE186]|uniref:hypothetical protein n=1 Tax=Methylobacterium sp. BE186 TaxID=2817715 RepID=UPI002859C107|nr:hypothetical protein [Methylobacterium sp. BE186]MDR7039620.1 hypothetical protein [Methylobacterium sp. BE186]